ncbi:hypothetical protein GGR54DRAFT_632365 [Hypoxylon sp. NC1633]|nr:hypothetical protein GGR54DRAFT_632365 [Hypoxylon sp. NC1633]
MDVEVRGRVLWELFVVLHPVFKKALPKMVDGNEVDLSTKNDITKIRHDIRAIPLIFPDADLDQKKLDGSNFSQPLYSLLEVLETLVANDIAKDYVIQTPDFADPQEQFEYEQLKLKFTNLMTMRGVLRSINPTPELFTAPSKRQRKLAGYVNFVDLEGRRKYSSREIVKSISDFRSAVEKLFRDPIEALERSLGNVAQLAHDETSFIHKAYHVNSLSRKLFGLLMDSITCSGVHAAQLHLSGFLTPDASFEVLIADCREEHWYSAKYRWANASIQGAQRNRTEQIVCVQQRDQAAPRHTLIAFDEEGMWNDKIQDGEPYNPSISDRDLTLHELIFPTHQDANPEALKLKAQEKKTLEFLVACSLLNLDTSHWVRLGLDIDRISVRLAREASNLLRWKPHITSSLQTVDGEDDENAAVLSFGLLIMEIEANRVAKPKEEDKDWDRDGFSRDSILKRILGEWADDVEDNYKNIATACLLFRQLSERFYDPLLTQDTKRTGAIYKYILAPLFRLVTGRFHKIRDLFPGIPESTYSRLPSSDHNLGHPTSTSDMIIFDGSGAAIPTQQ